MNILFNIEYPPHGRAVWQIIVGAPSFWSQELAVHLGRITDLAGVFDLDLPWATGIFPTLAEARERAEKSIIAEDCRRRLTAE